MKYRDGDLPQLPRQPALLDNNQQDYATQLNKALQLQVRPPGHIEATIGVGIQLDDWTKPEFAILRRMALYGATAQVAAVAAQYPMAQLICNTPNTLIVLERLILTNTNAAGVFCNYGWGGFDGGVTVVPEARDSRNYGLAGTAYLTRQTAAAPTAPQPAMGNVYVPVGATVDVPLQVVITNPTRGFVTSPCFKVLTGTVNTSLVATFVWRERSLLQTEAL
jgi:hypothetical protein